MPKWCFGIARRMGKSRSEANPNGSLDNIAGIRNAAGNVLGIMPHPERCAEIVLGNQDGLLLFRSMVDALHRMYLPHPKSCLQILLNLFKPQNSSPWKLLLDTICGVFCSCPIDRAHCPSHSMAFPYWMGWSDQSGTYKGCSTIKGINLGILDPNSGRGRIFLTSFPKFHLSFPVV